MKNKSLLPQMIREAVNSYPGGLCFAMPDGRPVLVNRKINALVSELTGHTVLDARALWKEIEALEAERGWKKSEEYRELMPAQEQDGHSFPFADGTIWRFRKDMLQDGRNRYIQIEATDVTDLYSRTRELIESNRKLRELSRRQHDLLTDIVQINRERELLQAKMRIHADLGRCLIATKKALDEQVGREHAKSIVQAWEDAIRNLANIPEEEKPAGDSMEKELLQVAQMIGCQIRITGERPAGLRAQQLLFASVREALTNAVRHANANELTVSCERTGRGYHVEISDNGKQNVDSIREGGGLRSLRQRLEQEGAALEIRCRDGVRLLIDLPVTETEER